MKTVFYLARHGQTQWNVVQRFQGQLDSELTDLGKQQSVALANVFVSRSIKQKIDHIISSPLGRAVATADICSQLLNVIVKTDAKLMERDLGPWQGQYLANIAQEAHFDEILHRFTERTPEHGESAKACGQRIYQAITQLALAHQGEQLLVIFHGEALRCFLSTLGQVQCGNAYELFKNASVVELIYCHESASFSLV